MSDRKNSNSIKRRTAYISAFVIAFISFFLVAMLYCFNAYDEPMEYYSAKYSNLTSVTVSLYQFQEAAYNYSSSGGKYNYNAMNESFESLESTFGVLHSTRYEYDSVNKNRIDTLKEYLADIETAVGKMTAFRDTAELKSVYTSELEPAIHSFASEHYDIAEELTEIANDKYTESSSAMFYVKIVTSLIYSACVIVVIMYAIFVNKRIAAPIYEINDWANLFRDNYADMAELSYDKNDEFKDLSDSFNIVRERLIQANEYKKEYEQALTKLKEEEQHKKSFVQQLYEEKKEKETITTEARHDGLTGLYNRRSFDKIVTDFLQKRKLEQDGFLFLIDMDNFKSVNDTLGHLAGDEALKTLAGAMRTVFPDEYLGRYGGDEFTVFIASKIPYEELNRKAEELRSMMDREFVNEAGSVNLSVSIGIAGTQMINEYAELYLKADKALYNSKEHGRNQYTIADEDWRL